MKITKNSNFQSKSSLCWNSCVYGMNICNSSGRNLLNTDVIDYYEENMEFFKEFMKIGLHKINQKIENQHKTEDKSS